MSVVPLPPEFRLERYFAIHEFSARYLLCCSDAEALSMSQLLEMANEEEMKMWNQLKLGYTESQGLEVLRDEIVKTLYPNCTKDDVIIGAPQELIYMAMRCMASPGDHVIAPFPAYQSLYANLTSIGCTVDKWEPQLVEDEEVMEEEKGKLKEGSGDVKDVANKRRKLTRARWRFSVSSLERLVKPTTKLIVVNFPHNPTGAVLDAADWKRLVEMCRRRSIALFSDEMYKYLVDDGEGESLGNGGVLTSATLPSACDVYEKATSLFGVSKSLSLPGLRIGWLVTRDGAVIDKLKSFKDYLSICSSAPSEILSLIAIRNMKRILKLNRDLVAANLRLLDEFFAKYPNDYVFARESAGTTTFVKIREDGPMAKALSCKKTAVSDNVDPTKGIASLFCEELLRRKNVLLLPAAEYDGSKDVYFRLGFARADLAEGLEEWGDFMCEIMTKDS